MLVTVLVNRGEIGKPDDQERHNQLLQAIGGKRLTYRRPSEAGVV